MSIDNMNTHEPGLGNLKEPPTYISPEERVIAPVKGRVITFDEFEAFREGNEFSWRTNRGTASNPDFSLYLYAKPGFKANTEIQAKNNLQLLERVTQFGLFYPNTQWGIFQGEVEKFHIFGIARRLATEIPLTSEGKKWQRLLSRRELTKDLGHEPSSDEWYHALFLHRNSHFKMWLDRVTARDLFTPDEKQELQKFLYLTNFAEASHTTNWGWDPETGQLYPLDLEIISLEGEEANRIVNDLLPHLEKNV